ncbi:prolyl aminopeptidase [Rhizobium daejeonense]|uniref:Proline iminopeptidase n=1 Tax=Rhizobium daejeonense TaxID=240521 RepID=A0A6M1S8K5_9HYPH|nr:prolyl aminopeptidase [Rhizobium daejeonense]NGO65767.1 prolyl aminopeptidase [Rhizobium daejeonense]
MTETVDTTRRGLYPVIEPFDSGFLQVSPLHRIYYEQCGNPDGKPALVLHGGPGGGISPFLRRGHDPERYRIILFDQRGCGQSTPYAELADNTTWDLVADIETLRQHLGIERWQVVGGSWGSTLALAYAITHRLRVTELIVRGIFAVRTAEVRWFYQSGASFLYPDAFDRYLAPIPETERDDLLAAYYQRLTGGDAAGQLEAAKAWSAWEGAALSLIPDPEREASFAEEETAVALARLECHYFVNGGFFVHDGWLLDQASGLEGLPGEIIQGRYDLVTPMQTAHDLAKRWPDATFTIVPDAGHSGVEPGIADAMVRATDRFAS